MRTIVAHRARLAAMLESVKAARVISLNLATFWTATRLGQEAATGCLVGHYIRLAKPGHLELVPLNFLEQVKSPLLAEPLFGKYPNTLWRHHDVHYHGPDIEAWGLHAVCLYFRLREHDARSLFYAAGHGGQMVVETSRVTDKLERFLSAEKAVHDDSPVFDT
jgi:hypothetical protein